MDIFSPLHIPISDAFFHLDRYNYLRQILSQGFSWASLNLRAERVNLRTEVKWPQATSSPEGQAV